QIRLERELVIDPAFFYALQQHFPQISHVEVQLKRGDHQNEMTLFRYDVVLHIGPRPQPKADFKWVDWSETGLTVTTLKDRLQTETVNLLGFRNIPNARVKADVKAVELLATAADITTASDLEATVQASAEVGIDPEALWALGADLGQDVQITWGEHKDTMDVVFRRLDASLGSALPLFQWREPTPSRPWHTYATNPMRSKLSQALIPELRKQLQASLPTYMQPATYVVLDKLPLTPNGKIDRKTLPAPENKRPQLAQSYEAPKTDMEAKLVEIWRDLLNLDKVGIYDNFFELGGSSLLSLQVVNRIRQNLGVEIVAMKLIQFPTVNGLAKHLDGFSDDQPALNTAQDRGKRQRNAFAGRRPKRR
ncbi:MAG: phosphopantetheine-binding protein, partial [Chloroflexota bacterium]